VWYTKYHGSPYSHKGVPDLLICWNGTFVAVEVKVPGEKPTPAQALQIANIIKAGGKAFWCTSLLEFKLALSLAVSRTPPTG
jgi:hypothetical protein